MKIRLQEKGKHYYNLNNGKVNNKVFRHIPCAAMPPMERITQAQRYKVATERYGTEFVERFFKDQNNGQDLSEDLPNTPFYQSQYMG